MLHTIEQIQNYIESLPDEQSEALKEENFAVLSSYETYNGNDTTNYEFPNGYGFSYWYDAGRQSYCYCSYKLDNSSEIISERDYMMQVQCWIAAWKVMKLPPCTKSDFAERIIHEIRSKCTSPDELAKIKHAVDCMQYSMTLKMGL